MDSRSGDISIHDLLKAIASRDAGHGAVAASAVAGGLATSLLLMAAGLPQTRSGSVEDRATLLEAATALSDVQEQLMEAIETETAVTLFAARNLPQASAAQRSERQAAIQIALRAAADVPLEVMRLCVRGLALAETVAAHSCRAALADVEMAVALLSAAVNGARSNLEGKISSLTDKHYITTIADEIARLTEQATVATHSAAGSVRVPPT